MLRKSKVILLSLVTLLSACGMQARKDFDYEVAPKKFQESRKEAIQWIEQSMDSEDWSTAEVAKLKKLQKLLLNSSLNYVENQEGTPCTDESMTAAFVLHPNEEVEIFVCQLSDQFSSSFVAQVLVHEVVHLGGIFDECETTRFELEITRNSGRIPFKNAYVSRCGLN
jgi:hypothetical protein